MNPKLIKFTRLSYNPHREYWMQDFDGRIIGSVGRIKSVWHVLIYPRVGPPIEVATGPTRRAAVEAFCDWVSLSQIHQLKPI